MKKTLWRLYEGFTKTKAVIVALVAVVYMALVVQSGGRLWELALFALVVVGYIVLPGLAWADILGTRRFAPGFTGPAAILLGGGFFAAVYCVSMYMHLLWALYILPPLLGLAWLVFKLVKGKDDLRDRLKGAKPRLQPQHWMLMLLWAALLLFFTFYGVVKHALPSAVGGILADQDLLWNVGNANSFKMGFPPEDIRFFGVRLKYHYLTELLAGALSLVSGISTYNILAFYMQSFMLAAMVLCSYKFGRIMWPESMLKSVLFAYSPFLFGCASLWKILPNGWSVFGNSNVTHLVTNVNSQTTAIVFLCIFLGFLVQAMRKRYQASLVHYVVLLAAFFMLTFAKGPLAAIVLCGLGLTLVFGLLQRRTTWRGLVFGLAAAALFIVVYTTMFSGGANDSMPLSFTGTLSRGYFVNIEHRIFVEFRSIWPVAVPILWVLQSFLMMPAQFPLYVRGVGHDLAHLKELAPERMLAQGVVPGGLLAYFLFSHPHGSQVYFLFASVFFINILAVDKIEWLNWPKKSAGDKKSKFRVLAQKGFVAFTSVCIAVSVITSGFLYVHYLGSGGRQLLRNLGITEKYPYEVVITPDDEAAMLWLRDNSPEDAMFATNRIHTGSRAEGISNLYSAYSGRQGYMEGFQYAKTNMGVSDEIINERLTVNNALFSAETDPQQVVQLCLDNGISYLVYSTQLPGDESQLSALKKVYDSPTVRIYAVPQKTNEV